MKVMNGEEEKAGKRKKKGISYYHFYGLYQVFFMNPSLLRKK
jgi:hypothetical protein